MTTPLPEDLASLLQFEIATVEKMSALLQEEHLRLKHREFEPLEQLSVEKISIMEELERITVCRYQLLGLAVGCSQNELQDRIESHQPAQEGTVSLWAELQQLAHACKLQNEKNAAIVTASQNAISQLSKLLRGEVKSLTLYGAKGQLQETTGTRRLTSA